MPCLLFHTYQVPVHYSRHVRAYYSRHVRAYYSRHVRTTVNHKICTLSSAQLNSTGSAAHRTAPLTFFFFVFVCHFFRKSSPAELSSAAQRRALPSHAVRCGAVPGCVLCGVYYLHTWYHTKYHTRYRCTSYVRAKSQKMRSQLNSASSAAQRGAVRCHSVPCPAL